MINRYVGTLAWLNCLWRRNNIYKACRTHMQQHNGYFIQTFICIFHSVSFDDIVQRRILTNQRHFRGNSWRILHDRKKYIFSFLTWLNESLLHKDGLDNQRISAPTIIETLYMILMAFELIENALLDLAITTRRSFPYNDALLLV